MSNLTELPTEEVRAAFSSLEEFTDILKDRGWRYLEARNPYGRLSHLPGPNVMYSSLYSVTVKNMKEVLFEGAEYVEFEVETLHSPNVPRVSFKIARAFALTADPSTFLKVGCSMD